LLSEVDMINRTIYIDVAKGISITLVAIFHSNLKSFFPEIIEPMALFRLPLFFFLSGVFFSYSISPKAFIFKKAEALLKPYFSVLFMLFFFSVISQDDNLISQLKGIFYGNGNTIRWVPLWFLTHLFSVYCFSYFIFRFTRFNALSYYNKSILLLIFLFSGSLLIGMVSDSDLTIFNSLIKLPELPFSIDIILITSVYFISGFLLKDKIINFSPNTYLFILSIIIFICIISFSEAHTDLNKRLYKVPTLATLGAACGIYFILSVSWFIAKNKALMRIPLALGSSSLYILIFHKWIEYNAYSYAYGYTSKSTADNIIFLTSLAILAFLLSISIPLLIKWVVNRNAILALFFLPFKTNPLLQRTFYSHR
jgi:fucose 4-O-acetylase-like acetyltransferase